MLARHVRSIAAAEEKARKQLERAKAVAKRKAAVEKLKAKRRGRGGASTNSEDHPAAEDGVGVSDHDIPEPHAGKLQALVERHSHIISSIYGKGTDFEAAAKELLALIEAAETMWKSIADPEQGKEWHAVLSRKEVEALHSEDSPRAQQVLSALCHDCLFHLGYVEVRSGSCCAAVRHLQLLIHLYPDFHRAWVLRGRAYSRMGVFLLANLHFKRVEKDYDDDEGKVDPETLEAARHYMHDLAEVEANFADEVPAALQANEIVSGRATMEQLRCILFDAALLFEEDTSIQPPFTLRHGCERGPLRPTASQA